MRDIELKPCPRCGCKPMIWTTPKGAWWAACSNNGKNWHEIIQTAHMNSRKKLFIKWNKLTDDLWCDGVTVKRHRDRPVPQDAPYWIPADKFKIFYSCSNCGYTLAPRIELCPNCLKRMRPYPREVKNDDSVP